MAGWALKSENLARARFPVVRASGLARYSTFLQSAGVPAGRLLGEAGIPPAVVAYPRALVSLKRAYRFGRLACRALGSEHLGLLVAEGETLEDIPVYGQMAAKSRTVHDYLIRGSRLFRMQSSGVRFELKRRGRVVRLYRRHALVQDLASYQTDLEAFAVTIRHLRQALGTSWNPDAIGFAYAPKEALPQVDLFGHAQILHDRAAPYLEFPAQLLEATFPHRPPADTTNLPADPSDGSALPSRLRDLVELQLHNLLPATDLRIATIAASLGLSPRSLQRLLRDQGASYRQLVTHARFDAARNWLSRTDRSIENIAFDLGYADPANFTRAFRARAGMPPQRFREIAVIEHGPALPIISAL